MKPGPEDYFKIFVQLTMIVYMVMASGFWYGILFSYLLFRSYEFMLSKCLGLQPLYPIDNLFIYDSNKNRCNITGNSYFPSLINY